jgi:hypothetical protein
MLKTWRLNRRNFYRATEKDIEIKNMVDKLMTEIDETTLTDNEHKELEDMHLEIDLMALPGLQELYMQTENRYPELNNIYLRRIEEFQKMLNYVLATKLFYQDTFTNHMCSIMFIMPEDITEVKRFRLEDEELKNQKTLLQMVINDLIDELFITIKKIREQNTKFLQEVYRARAKNELVDPVVVLEIKVITLAFVDAYFNKLKKLGKAVKLYKNKFDK